MIVCIDCKFLYCTYLHTHTHGVSRNVSNELRWTDGWLDCLIGWSIVWKLGRSKAVKIEWLRHVRDAFVSLLSLFDLNKKHAPFRMVEIQSRMMCCHQAERNSPCESEVAGTALWSLLFFLAPRISFPRGVMWCDVMCPESHTEITVTRARCSRPVQAGLFVLSERSSYLVFRRMKKLSDRSHHI